MREVRYIDIDQAREVLAGIGIELTPRQMKRAADKGPHGQRKLPFFIDPIDGRLKIETNKLLAIYIRRQVDAEIAGRTSVHHDSFSKYYLDGCSWLTFEKERTPTVRFLIKSGT